MGGALSGKPAQIGAVAIVFLIIYGVAQEHSKTERLVEESQALTRPFEIAEKINPQRKGWQYESEKDEMRGTTTRVARLQADNYDTYSTPTLTLWQKSDGRYGAQLDSPMVVNAIGVQCDHRTLTVAVKIDNGPVRNLHCEMGMSIAIDHALVALVRKSNKLTLEAETSLGGAKQYSFTTSGLTL